MRPRSTVAAARTIHQTFRGRQAVLCSRPFSLLYSFAKELGALESGEGAEEEELRYFFGIMTKAIRTISAPRVNAEFDGLSCEKKSHVEESRTKDLS